jgi:hypothetical protein
MPNRPQLRNKSAQVILDAQLVEHLVANEKAAGSQQMDGLGFVC